MRDAKLDKEKIDEVVVVGGSTRTPKAQKLLSDFFNGKEPNKSSTLTRQWLMALRFWQRFSLKTRATPSKMFC